MDALKEFLQPHIIWFLIGLCLLLVEFALPGLVVFFFGVGAFVVAAITFFLPALPLTYQLLIFVVSSVALLLVLRRWLKPVFMGVTTGQSDMAENISEFVGETATVTEKITPAQKGKIDFHGTSWAAKADEIVEQGAIVEIVGQKNITLIIKPV